MIDQHRDKVDKMRTAGLYAKGSVYALIGILTTMAVLGFGGDIKGRKGVVDFLLAQPAGNVLVAIVAIGLLCYSLWRIYECIEDPDGRENENRTGNRLKYLYSGLVYGFIAYTFAKPLFSAGGGQSGGSKKKAALAQLLDKDWGVWVIGAIALALVIMAIYQVYRGWSGKFMAKIDNPGQHKKYKTVKNLGRIGYIARGVVFAILAFFLYQVMNAHSANQYKGTEGAFQWLLGQDYGTWLAAALAIGLLGYGIFTMAVARYSSLTRMS